MTTCHNELDVESVRSEVHRVAPQLDGATVAWLGEGMDSLAFSVGETFVFRFAKHAEAAAGLAREIALLPRIAPRFRVDVPRFEYVGEHSASGLPFVGYRFIRGEPLDRELYDGLPEAMQDGVHGDLASFLLAVHSFPVEEAVDCGVRPHGERSVYLEDLRRARDDIFPLLGGKVRYAIESRLDAFLGDDANFAYAPTLLHGDLWPEHVLFSRTAGRLSGIIDFSDLCIGDPDYDLAFLARKLGPGFVAGMHRHFPHTEPGRFAGKVCSIALLNAIDDILLGLDRGDRSLVDSAIVYLIEQGQADPQS